MVPELDLALVYLGFTTSSLSCRRRAVVGESLRQRIEESKRLKLDFEIRPMYDLNDLLDRIFEMTGVNFISTTGGSVFCT